jgi:hypothetical protein
MFLCFGVGSWVIVIDISQKCDNHLIISLELLPKGTDSYFVQVLGFFKKISWTFGRRVNSSSVLG